MYALTFIPGLGDFSIAVRTPDGASRGKGYAGSSVAADARIHVGGWLRRGVAVPRQRRMAASGATIRRVRGYSCGR